MFRKLSVIVVALAFLFFFPFGSVVRTLQQELGNLDAIGMLWLIGFGLVMVGATLVLAHRLAGSPSQGKGE